MSDTPQQEALDENTPPEPTQPNPLMLTGEEEDVEVDPDQTPEPSDVDGEA